MNNLDSITEKRWFMGKGRSVSGINEYDSFKIGNNTLSIVKVDFKEGFCDYYAVVQDESKFGEILAECFMQDKAFSAIGSQGALSTTVVLPRSRETLQHAKPLDAEQSNSSFYSKGEFFFKLYRRLQGGMHPETEILEHLSKKVAMGAPKIAPCFYGVLRYADAKSNEIRDLGILEEHVPDAKNAWEIFTDTSCTDSTFYEKASRELGRTTAAMHDALKDLNGTATQPEEVPYDKLIALLKATRRDNLAERVERIRTQQGQEITKSNVLTPQRIHGDYHLGQLLYKDGKFIVLDFEGEPTRTLEYRRRLRSPAADIAGMLRSFAYASAVRNDKDFEQLTAEAFLQGYSEESGIPVPQLKEEASPYVLGKAIYEACYELEFRPDWFWIPEKALKN